MHSPEEPWGKMFPADASNSPHIIDDVTLTSKCLVLCRNTVAVCVCVWRKEKRRKRRVSGSVSGGKTTFDYVHLNMHFTLAFCDLVTVRTAVSASVGPREIWYCAFFPQIYWLTLPVSIRVRVLGRNALQADYLLAIPCSNVCIYPYYKTPPTGFSATDDDNSLYFREKQDQTKKLVTAFRLRGFCSISLLYFKIACSGCFGMHIFSVSLCSVYLSLRLTLPSTPNLPLTLILTLINPREKEKTLLKSFQNNQNEVCEPVGCISSFHYVVFCCVFRVHEGGYVSVHEDAWGCSISARRSIWSVRYEVHNAAWFPAQMGVFIHTTLKTFVIKFKPKLSDVPHFFFNLILISDLI